MPNLAVCNRLAPELKNFTETGYASGGFLAHLDKCDYCGAAVDLAFDRQAKAFEAYIRYLRARGLWCWKEKIGGCAMTNQLPKHPWVEWAKFVKDVKSRHLSEEQEAALAKQNLNKYFGDDGNGFIAAIMHAQKCKKCRDANKSVERMKD